MDRIIFADGKEFECEVASAAYEGRAGFKFKPVATYEEINKYFRDGASYSWVYEAPYTLEDGTKVMNKITKDLSEFNIGMDIIDKRNGEFWVHMGKKTVEEENIELKAQLVEKDAVIIEKELALSAAAKISAKI